MQTLLSLICFIGIIGFFVGIVMLFKKTWRKNGLRIFIGGIVLTVIAIILLPNPDDAAREAGFANAEDKNLALSHGISDPAQWNSQKTDLLAKDAEKKQKELAAQEEQKQKEQAAKQAEELFYTIPSDETSFIKAVQSASESFANATNDLAKGGTRRERAKAVCMAIPSPSIKDWIGTITELTTNGDGLGVLSVKLSDNISVKTWNNAVSDVFDKTLIDPDSSVFKVLSQLKKGDKIKFSGQFTKDHNKTDCYHEASVSLAGSMEEPEYIFKFSSISTYNPNQN